MSSPEEDLADLTGRRIGKYEMIARIGVGGMGVVYEGRRPDIGKRVAVKFLLPSLSKDKELLARFKAEANAVNAIGHRGIVDIFDFDQTEDGTQYFVMEYLDGRPFDQVIAKEAPMHPALALRYLEEILEALNAAHQAGVIHRDIKPSNIFLVEGKTTRPYIKLLDFGIAKVGAPKTGSTPQTRQSVVIGTPEYIAPEQAQGKAISAATDLYAIGCMAFELLTGKLPFHGDNPLDTMFKHVVEPTPRVRGLSPSVPAQIDELVWKLMQKRPDDRPASASDVLKSLEQLRGAMTLDAAPPAPSLVPNPAARDPIVLEPTLASKPVQTSEQEVLRRAIPPQSPLRYVVVAAVVLSAVTLTTYALLRGPTQDPVTIVEPPPPRAVLDAGALAVVTPVPAEVADAGAKIAVVPPPTKPVTPPKRGISAAQLNGRIGSLERKLEQREVARGEALPVLRSFLKQAKADAAKAKSDADRKEVWVFLDDVAPQIER